MPATGASVLAAALAAAGVRTLFNLSGNQIMPLYSPLVDAGIDLVHTRHEASAVHMADAHGRLSRQDILRHWPDPDAAPAKQTLWKWLDQLVKEGRVLRDGRGSKTEPYEYSLPGMLDKWHAAFLADLTRRLADDTPLA